MRPLPAVGEPRRLSDIDVQRATLANGIELVSVERRDLPLVDVEFIVQPGAVIDSPVHAGRVSMLGEMLDEGTATRSALVIADELDYLGAQLDIRAGWDTLALSLHSLSKHLPDALNIAADSLTNAAFPDREFKRKQDERLGTLRQDRDEAAVLASKALARGIFGDEHPFGAPLYGTVPTISQLSVDDLRSLYRDVSRSRKLVVLAVGDFETAALARELEKELPAWPQSASEQEQLPAIPKRERRILLVDKPGAAQAELRVGHAAPARNTADYFAITVMNTVLGGSFTSRLNTVLRERMGVTYGASSRFRLRCNAGVFSVGSAVFTEAAARSAQVVVDEMQHMIEELVPADQLQRAQSYLALGLPREFETCEDVALHLRDQIVYDLPSDYWQTYVDRVFAVTADDVAAAAARHLQPAGCTIVVAADAKEVRKALENAGLGEVIDTALES